VDVVSLLNYDVYRRRMTEQIDEQSELCRRLRGELTQARRDLMEACREQQRLQILRDSHYEQYCRELAALENKQLDEAGVQAWHMRGSGSLALNLSAPEPRDAG
jgi:flagellar export protein FliJ